MRSQVSVDIVAAAQRANAGLTAAHCRVRRGQVDEWVSAPKHGGRMAKINKSRKEWTHGQGAGCQSGISGVSR